MQKTSRPQQGVNVGYQSTRHRVISSPGHVVTRSTEESLKTSGDAGDADQTR